jgi:hypothetical protein
VKNKIYLTFYKDSIRSVLCSEDWEGINFDCLATPSGIAGLHVGVKECDWHLGDREFPCSSPVPLWLTAAAHEILREIMGASFGCTLHEIGGEKLYRVNDDWIGRVVEKFRAQTHARIRPPGDADSSAHGPAVNQPQKNQTVPRSMPLPAHEENSEYPFEHLKNAPEAVLRIPVQSAGFSKRVKGCFARRNVSLLRDLIPLRRSEMLGWRNFGPTSLQDAEVTLQKLLQQTDEQPLPECWIRSLELTSPALHQALRDAGIGSEADYAARESLIASRPSRIGIAEFRFRALTAGCDASADPGLIVRSCPPWVQSRKIQSITMPNSCLKKLGDNGIEAVADLAPLEPGQILRWKSTGKETLKHASKWLPRAIQEGPTDHASLDSRYQGQRVKDWIEASFEDLKSLVPEILNANALEALEGRSSGMTMQQIGDAMTPPLTRARVEQLEQLAIEVFRKRAFWVDVLERKLGDIFKKASEPVLVSSLAQLAECFRDDTDYDEKFYWLLKTLLPDPVYLISSSDFPSEILARIPQREWSKAVSDARNLLRSSVSVEPKKTESDLRSQVYGILPATASELREALWRAVSGRAIFSEDNGVRRLCGYGAGSEIVDLLEASENPLHWSEIVKTVKGIKPSKVKALLLELENVFWFGRGTYGARKHLHLSDEELELIAVECGVIALGAAGRQWSCKELYTQLTANDFQLDGRNGQLDQYIINDCLRLYGKAQGFVNVGRLNWRLGGNPGANSRLQILPACLDILRESGSPMSFEKLRQELERIRGLSASFQIITFHKNGCTLIRLDSETVGILERDGGPLCGPDKRKELCVSVFDALRQNQRGLHLSELDTVGVAASLMKDHKLDPILLVNVCRLSPEMGFSRGNYLYLKEWGEDRRHTVNEAIIAAFEGFEKGLTTQQLREKVCEKLGRIVQWVEIQAALYKTNVRRDVVNDCWVLMKWAEEQEVENKGDEA